MKKYLCVLLLLLCVALPSCTSNEVKETVAETIVETENIVYVTPAGKKYHKEGCMHIRQSKLTALSVDQAEKKGYTPCKTCY